MWIAEEASSIARTSSVVSSMVAPPRFSSSRESLVVPGIGTIQGCFAQPCESNLCGRGFLLLCKLCQHVDERLIGFAVFLAETRDDGTEVGAAELGGCVDFPGKEAFAERAERNEADAELFQCRHDGFFGLPPEEGILALQCGN